MALINTDQNIVLNYAEKRASESQSVEDCVVVYSYVSSDGNIYYVADGVDPDSEAVPDFATYITHYGMCSWLNLPQVDEAFVG